MSLLLTEDGNLLLTETTDQHLLIEPVITSFGVRLSGVAQIYQLGHGWAMDTPTGIVKAQNPSQLAREALRAGATRVDFI